MSEITLHKEQTITTFPWDSCDGTLVVNFGPQHPSTHGVFRLMLELEGETIVGATPVMGYLHRSIEKLSESRSYLQCVPFTDRLDYLAPLSANLAYALAVEKLAGIEVPERAEYIRVIMVELNRIASHCMAVGSLANDAGAFYTPFLYTFRDREKILDLFEIASGQRMTPSYIRFGGVSRDLPERFVPMCRWLMDEMPRNIDEYERMLTTNEIFLARTRDIGVLSPDMAVNYSVTGPVLRASGVGYDLRKVEPNGLYQRFDFDIPVGDRGDSYDRYLVRIREMRESVKIVQQALRDLPGGDVRAQLPKVLRPPKGDAYAQVESPKGVLGFYLVSDGGPKPYRLKIRAPSFINLTALKPLLIGHKVADAIVILGSFDIILGEVDR
ncbi:MAG: NADH-quinone oxidoreductase subunit D [Chloroflexota bacterium]|jgi:NADH-quinone oxidoreductase subunit D